MYTYGWGSNRRRSSRPSHLTQPNGLNFSRSVGNPNSRIERIREYLRVNGPSTKKDILYYVFGKNIGRYPNGVTRGWGAYVFGLGVKCGYLTKTRKGGTTYWSLT